MNKALIALVCLVFVSSPFCLKAQDEKPEVQEKKEMKEKAEKKEKKEIKEKSINKETQEIVIRSKDGKDLNLKVEAKGDKVTINGKPLEEFKEDGITINNRKMIIRDGESFAYHFGPEDMTFSKDFMGSWEGGKEVARAFLGVTTEEAKEGAKVTNVVKESAAEKAGLKKDDIITKVGDKVITDGDNLSDVISAKKPKEVVTVTYLRNGNKASVKATLGEKKMKAPRAFAYNHPGGKVRSFSMPRVSVPDINVEGLEDWGAVAPMGEDNLHPYIQAFPRQKRLGLKIQDMEEGGNVKVIEVEEGSAAEKAGLKKDDIITEINGEKVDNTDDAREQLMPSEDKSAYTIKAKRNGAEMTFEVKFPKKLKTANL